MSHHVAKMPTKYKAFPPAPHPTGQSSVQPFPANPCSPWATPALMGLLCAGASDTRNHAVCSVAHAFGLAAVSCPLLPLPWRDSAAFPGSPTPRGFFGTRCAELKRIMSLRFPLYQCPGDSGHRAQGQQLREADGPRLWTYLSPLCASPWSGNHTIVPPSRTYSEMMRVTS